MEKLYYELDALYRASLNYLDISFTIHEDSEFRTWLNRIQMATIQIPWYFMLVVAFIREYQKIPFIIEILKLHIKSDIINSYGRVKLRREEQNILSNFSICPYVK